MKRFFCTICQRVKRVRQYPSDVTNEYSNVAKARVGTCARHSSPVAVVKSVNVDFRRKKGA